jgi:hypothetical protein
MGKKFILGTLVSLALVVVSASANDELKLNMYKLNNHMIQMQSAFINGDKDAALKAATALQEEAKILFNNESNIKKMLPEDKRFKSHIAVTSAASIDEDIVMLKDSMDDTRRDTAQNAYLNIQRACMRCHNLVRDW